MSLYVSILCSHMSVCNMCLLCTFAFGCPHMSNIWPCSFATGALTDVTFVRVRLPFVFHTCIRVRLPFVFHTCIRIRLPVCVPHMYPCTFAICFPHMYPCTSAICFPHTCPCTLAILCRHKGSIYSCVFAFMCAYGCIVCTLSCLLA